jgi:hypothetical protein
MLLAPVNSGYAAEKLRLRYGSVLSIKRVAFGDQQSAAISVSRLEGAPEYAMNEEAPVALVQNYVTDGDGVKCTTTNKHIIPGSNPGEHTLPQDTEAH